MIKPLTAGLLLLALAGCTSPSNTAAITEHTANLTAAAKRDAGAIARGVAQGLVRKGPLDLNSASAAQLAKLPGMSPERADSIVKHRPYTAPKDLVKRKILTPAQFNRIKPQVLVNEP